MVAMQVFLSDNDGDAPKTASLNMILCVYFIYFYVLSNSTIKCVSTFVELDAKLSLFFSNSLKNTLSHVEWTGPVRL